MKILIALILLITPFFNSFAQPGDEHNYFRYTEFKSVQDSIKKYPDDYFYKWVRLDILFKPRFDLYSKSTAQIADFFKYMDFYREYDGPDSILVFIPQPCQMCPDRQVKIWNPTREMGDFLIQNQTLLMSDLSLLIKQDVKIEERQNLFWSTPGNKATFLYRRGQFYYLSGEPDKAKNDYFMALESEPTNELKKEILISITAYYYTQDSVTEDSQRQALKYLDMYISNGGANHRNYETEKINLLKSLKDSTTLVNYLQDQAARCWKNYYDQLKIDAYKNDRYIADAIRYEQLLFEYLTELDPEFSMEDFKRHKNIIMEKL